VFSNKPSPSTQAPTHVAIVMDGNGRWAQKRGQSRIKGHQAGVKTVREIVSHAASVGTKYLTIYSFSTENWKRPAEEIQALFGLLKTFVGQDLERLNRENVKVRVVGSKANLPEDILKLLETVEKVTSENTKLNLNIAFNYGGRDEIVRMVQKISNSVSAGELSSDQITEEIVGENLDTKGQPDPDLIIRTGGESRISNFLLWQSAYTEFVLLDVLWPDFTTDAFDEALQIFSTRARRLGGV